MKKTIVAAVAAFVLFVNVLSLPSFAYSRENAVNYADTYVGKYNDNYRYFVVNGNCTNFVSQCLYAGGVPMDGTWYYKNSFSYSPAWTVANDLKNYMKNNLGAERLVSKWKKVADPAKGVYGYINNSGNLTNTGIEIVFYDWQDDGIIDHSSIVVGTGNALDGTGYGDLIDQNSTDRKHTIWHLDKFNDSPYETAIYAFRLY